MIPNPPRHCGRCPLFLGSIKNAPGGPVIEWPRGVGWGEQGGGPGVGRRRRTGLYDHDLDPMVVDDLATMQHNGREL